MSHWRGTNLESKLLQERYVRLRRYLFRATDIYLMKPAPLKMVATWITLRSVTFLPQVCFVHLRRLKDCYSHRFSHEQRAPAMEGLMSRLAPLNVEEGFCTESGTESTGRHGTNMVTGLPRLPRSRLHGLNSSLLSPYLYNNSDNRGTFAGAFFFLHKLRRYVAVPLAWN